MLQILLIITSRSYIKFCKTASSFAFRSLFDHLTTMMYTGIDIERPYTLLAEHTQTQKIKKKFSEMGVWFRYNLLTQICLRR